MKFKQKRINLISILVIAILSSFTLATEMNPNDATISMWVAEVFEADPRISVHAVDIKTSEGIVTLKGSVRTLAGKHYAGMETRKINGVRGLVNQLTVNMTDRSDDEMAEEIRRRLTHSAGVSSKTIQVQVNDGIAHLKGSVASWAECQEAEQRASQVVGIRAIRNTLGINVRSPRTDQQIKADVVTALNRDIYLNGLPITVTVHKGNVTLQGEVGNAYQRERARQTARAVMGVMEVKNEVTVTWWPTPEKRRPVSLPNDDTLKTAVQEAIQWDQRIDASLVTVEAAQGRVSLSGSVRSYYQRKLAEQNALEVVGTMRVYNSLVVNATPRNDAAIKADIRFEIDSSHTLKAQGIQVTVRQGVVTLSGTVQSLIDKLRVEERIAHVRGIKELVNTLRIQGSTDLTDTDLINHIQHSLETNLSTRWVADQIVVSVINAQVTLTGPVYTWGQRREAGRIATLTDGVRRVTNHLTVHSRTSTRP